MPDPEAFGRAPILAKDTDDADPIAQLVVALADLVWLLSRVDRTGFGPDSVRGRILDQLFRHEPLRQAVIGVRAGASASVTSRIIHRLERDGLVVRRPGTTDRRHTKVSLTERGNRLVRDSRRIRIERLGRLALHISPAAQKLIEPCLWVIDELVTVAVNRGGTDDWLMRRRPRGQGP